MKRFLGIVLFIALLLMSTLVSAESAVRTLISLDDFIARYNKLMVEIEYQATYGIDANLTNDDIFIKPGYVFRAADVLLTNFHLPQSTLLMLVSAFMGRENALAAYHEAVRERYRFFSFGDCMLIL